MTDEIEDAVFEEIEQQKEISDSTKAQLKDERKEHWRSMIEAELQIILTEAASIQNKIITAKTSIKKDFYKKKFNKVSAQVRQYIGALERLGVSITPEGTEDDITTTSITE